MRSEGDSSTADCVKVYNNHAFPAIRFPLRSDPNFKNVACVPMIPRESQECFPLLALGHSN